MTDFKAKTSRHYRPLRQIDPEWERDCFAPVKAGAIAHPLDQAKLIAIRGISRDALDLPPAMFPRIEPRNASEASHAARQRAMARAFGLASKKHPKTRRTRLPVKSLQWLVDRLGKSARTVRRWCELGLIPGAVRTKGGHWRVRCSAKIVAKVRRAVDGFARRRFGAKRRRRDDATADAILFEAHKLGSLKLAGRNLMPEDDQSWPKADLELDKRRLEAVSQRSDKALLQLAVKRLAMLEREATATSLARELEISRATLYRRFSVSDIRKALRVCAVDAPSPITVPADDQSPSA